MASQQHCTTEQLSNTNRFPDDPSLSIPLPTHVDGTRTMPTLEGRCRHFTLLPIPERDSVNKKLWPFKRYKWLGLHTCSDVQSSVKHITLTYALHILTHAHFLHASKWTCRWTFFLRRPYIEQTTHWIQYKAKSLAEHTKQCCKDQPIKTTNAWSTKND